MSWFLKYRPRQIADLDLAQVRQQLLSLMDSATFPHSFLFAGPKGTGKTSASRIIGAMLNDLANQQVVEQIFFQKTKPTAKLQEPDPDTDFARRVFSGQSLVVQEMDAASHRGIDDIRQLKERAYITPQEGSVSVYILDEVHMLTNEAFNALLKILEEPPAHVVFILATTELHKVPATIVSRCNLINFYKAGSSEVIERLKKILKSEKIKFDEEALLEIARRADGSFRDAVKLTEIAAQSGKVSLEQVEQLLGGSALVEVKKLLELVLAKNDQGIAEFFASLRQRHFNEEFFTKSLFDYLHHSMLAKLGVVEFETQLELKVSQFLLVHLSKLDLKQASPIAFLPLELLLLTIVQKARGESGGGDAKQTPPSKKKPEKNDNSSKQAREATSPAEDDELELASELESETEPEPEPETEPEPEVFASSSPLNGDSLSQNLCENWQQFLQMVEQRNLTLAALLRSGQPQPGPNGLAEIKVYYRFHQEQLEQPKLKQIVEECGEKIVGDKLQFKFTLTTPPTEAEVVDVPAQTEALEAIAEEVLM